MPQPAAQAVQMGAMKSPGSPLIMRANQPPLPLFARGRGYPTPSDWDRRSRKAWVVSKQGQNWHRASEYIPGTRLDVV